MGYPSFGRRDFLAYEGPNESESAKGVKPEPKFAVGDTVVITNVNGGDRRATVEKVGRTTVYAGGKAFDLETGRWKNKGYSSHYHIRTLAEDIAIRQRAKAEQELCEAGFTLTHCVKVPDALLLAVHALVRDWPK